MSFRVYLASRFSRLPELNQYRIELAREGIEVTSRWLLGGHEWEGVDDDQIPPEHAMRFAQEDLQDILRSDAIVCFTEPARSGPSRGGRHVEMGYAYAMGKPVIVVGHRENVFYTLPDMQFCPTWEDAFHLLVNGAIASLAVANG